MAIKGYNYSKTCTCFSKFIRSVLLIALCTVFVCVVASCTESVRSEVSTKSIQQKNAAETDVDQTKDTLDTLFGSDFWSLCEAYRAAQKNDTGTGYSLDNQNSALLEKLARRLFDAMSTEERIAQLFMLTYYGNMPSASFLSWIQKRGMGGVKIFGWNADNTETLVESLRRIYRTAQTGPHAIPPFAATDQEGGWIRHVKGATSVTPGNMAIGASSWIDDAYWSGYYINRELYKLGILMNFAPTVDLATNPASSIIGSRAFSDNPEHSAYLAAAWMQGALDAGIMPVAKHFPGHGDTVYDSHGTLPVINVSKEMLEKRELVPYKLLIKEGLYGIMSGHLAFPQITGSREPASLSYTMITTILRKELQFDGIVITDDMTMQGALSKDSLEQACEKALMAGNDMILLSQELEPDSFIFNQFKNRYISDGEFRKRVDESVIRIIKAKIKYIGAVDRSFLLELPSGGRNLAENDEKQFFFEQAVRSVTRIGTNPFVPLQQTSKLLIVSPFYDFSDLARKAYPSAQVIKISYLPELTPFDEEMANFKMKLSAAQTVLVCVANPASARYAEEALKQGKKVYIISVLNPWHVRTFVNKATIIAVYSYAKESLSAGLLALQGKLPLYGVLPMNKFE